MFLKVTVRYLYPIREVTGTSEEKIEVDESSSVEDLLHILSKKYGESFERYVYSGTKHQGIPIILLLDEENIQSLEGLKTKLTNGSELTIIPPIAGG